MGKIIYLIVLFYAIIVSCNSGDNKTISESDSTKIKNDSIVIKNRVKVNKDFCFFYSGPELSGFLMNETIKLSIYDTIVTGERFGEVSGKDSWSYSGNFKGTIKKNKISVIEKTYVEGDEQTNPLEFILVNDSILTYGKHKYKKCKK